MSGPCIPWSLFIPNVYLLVCPTYTTMAFNLKKLRYISHTIKFIHLKCTLQYFCIFTQLCNHHHYLIPEPFHHPPKKKPCTHPQSLTIPPFPLPCATTSVCIDWTALEISNQWTDTTCDLYCHTHLVCFRKFIHVLVSISTPFSVMT